jgi:hypothetical protein
MPMVRHAVILSLVGAVACIPEPRTGSQIGSLREPEPAPQPPSDFKDLDMSAVVQEALALGGLTTLSAAWTGHMATLDSAPDSCPAIWLGPLPEDLVDIDMDDEQPGMSWLANCVTDPGNLTFSGFTHWSTEIVEDVSGGRTLVADAEVTDSSGAVLFAFDGEASDGLDLTSGQYSSVLNGEITGSLVGLGADGFGSGLRTGGEFEASWNQADASGLRLFGTVTAFDGFGPPDERDPATSPELENVPGWSQGMPRFTSVRYDLQFTEDCAEEPVGFIGIRGNEGFWFDVYFLPIYDPEEDTFQSKAFPYEEIDNVSCDGIGTLFARNVNLKEADAEDAEWSREMRPDFAASISALQTPSIEDYIYTLRQVTE